MVICLLSLLFDVNVVDYCYIYFISLLSCNIRKLRGSIIAHSGGLPPARFRMS